VSDAARIDLLARRQARLEAASAPRVFEFGDVSFEGPSELPLAFIEYIRLGRFVEAIGVLFGDRAEEFIFIVQPTVADLREIADTYGSDLGSSSPSIGS
jgi:hypothetical protein